MNDEDRFALDGALVLVILALVGGLPWIVGVVAIGRWIASLV